MTFEEFKKVAKGMKSIWTQQAFLPDGEAVKIWHELLKDLPYEQVSMAVTRYASTSNWPPTPADIRKQVVVINDESTDWGVAWQAVVRAIGKYGTHRETEALESMDEMTRRAISRLGWRQICQSEQSELTAIRANFRMIYEQIQTHEREEAQLPQALKNKIAKLTGKQDESTMLSMQET